MCSRGFIATAMVLLMACGSFAGVESTAIRDTAEWIFRTFGKGAAGESVEAVTESASRLVAKFGEECLPLLRKTGHAGFDALEEAGEKAPDVIKLYARKGDQALWIIGQPRRLAIFIKHGESAADALLTHPQIAEALITKYGEPAVGAISSVSREQGQRLGIMAADGTMEKIGRQPELLAVVRKHGDAAMDFIWKNKGALTVASALTTFLINPEVYINGTKQLVVDPIVSPIVKSVEWTLVLVVVLAVIFSPFITKSVVKSIRIARAEKPGTSPITSPLPSPAKAEPE